MNADPYNLDQSEFAKVLREIRDTDLMVDDLPDEPAHPLRNDATVAALCDYLQQTEKQLYAARNPNEEMDDDPYFQFDEGLVLRPEVIAKLMIDYIRKHPEMMNG